MSIHGKRGRGLTSRPGTGPDEWWRHNGKLLTTHTMRDSYEEIGEEALWLLAVRRRLRKAGPSTTAELAAACGLGKHENAKKDEGAKRERRDRERFRRVLRTPSYGLEVVRTLRPWDGGRVWSLADPGRHLSYAKASRSPRRRSADTADRRPPRAATGEAAR